MTVPAVPEPDDKDWTWVLLRPCPDCGYDPAPIEREQIAARSLAAVAELRARLDRAGATERPAPAVWSPLEYACHVRDVALLFRTRLQLLLEEDDPEFANWDQDETALADQYWTQSPAQVALELDTAADRMADAIDRVGPAAWSRPGRRSNGAVFTVETLCRYYLHDLVHHQHDVS